MDTTCQHCGAAVRQGAPFCGTCGRPQTLPQPYGNAPTGTQFGTPLGASAAGSNSSLLQPSPVQPRRRRVPKLAVMFGVLGALAVLGVLAWMFLLGGSELGASDPESAVQQLVDAANEGDTLAVANALAPSEVEGMADVAITLIDQMRLTATDFTTDIELVSAAVVEQADDAALVEVEFRVVSQFNEDLELDFDDRIDPNDFTSADILDILDEEGVEEIDALTLAVVREGGGWFVSPMLTAGDYITRVGDLAEADWQAASELPDATADTPEAAVEALAEALADFSVEDIAATADIGVARTLMVFQDAIDDGLDDNEGTFELDSIDVTQTDEGVELAGMELSYDDGYGYVETLTLDDWCIAAEDPDGYTDEGCADELEWLELPRRPVIVTTQERNGHVVDLIASLTRFADSIAPQITREIVLFGTDLTYLGDAQATSVGSSAPVLFGESPYVALDVPVTAGQELIVTLDNMRLHDQFFQPAGSNQWEYAWVTRSVEEAGTMRYVVVPEDDGDYCSGLSCRWPTGVEGTFEIREAFVQAVGFPSALTADLGSHDGYVFEFELTEPAQFSLDISGEVFVTVTPAGERPYEVLSEGYEAASPTDTYSLEAGSHRMWVINRSDEQTSFTVAPTDVESGGSDYTLDITDTHFLESSGTVEYTGFAPGSFVSVLAQHRDGGDIVLYADTSVDSCSADADLSPGVESCEVQIGDDGVLFVYVEPFDGGGAVGEVDIFIESLRTG